MWFLEFSSGSGEDYHHLVHFRGTTGHKNKNHVSIKLGVVLVPYIGYKTTLTAQQCKQLSSVGRLAYCLWHLDLLVFMYSSINVLIVSPSKSPTSYLVHLSVIFHGCSNYIWHEFSLLFSLLFYFPLISLKNFKLYQLVVIFTKINFWFYILNNFPLLHKGTSKVVISRTSSLTQSHLQAMESSQCFLAIVGEGSCLDFMACSGVCLFWRKWEGNKRK